VLELREGCAHQPPANELGSEVPLSETVVAADSVVICMGNVVAYSTGWAFDITFDDRRCSGGLIWERCDRPEITMRSGTQEAILGRAGWQSEHSGRWVRMVRGEGRGGGQTIESWVGGIPATDVEVAAVWESRGVRFSHTVLAASRLRAASRLSRPLWPQTVAYRESSGRQVGVSNAAIVPSDTDTRPGRVVVSQLSEPCGVKGFAATCQMELVHTDSVVLGVRNVVVFGSGFAFTLAVRATTRLSPTSRDEWWFGRGTERGFSDRAGIEVWIETGGRVIGSSRWSSLHTDSVVERQRISELPGGWDDRYWVSPGPDSWPITLRVEWPSQNLSASGSLTP
jgi:hypothetical protein